MNAIRLFGAVALATAVAGCAGTKDTGPTSIARAPVAAKPVTAPAQPSAAPALPQQVASVPQYFVPVERAAPAVIAVPVYEPARPAPMIPPQPVTVAPIYEPVQTPAVQGPVVLPVEPQYTAIGDLDTPAPVLESADRGTASTMRAMAPIRDEPQDGRDRISAETRLHARKGYRRNAALRAGGLKPKIRSNHTPAFGAKLEQAALDRLNPGIRYDARYVKIGYPWGDVPEETGVCSDVIIRSYRALGVDLQQLLHEDMKRAFRAYPSKRIYGLKRPDPNIDHRRVVNLEAFFERTGASIPVGTSPDDFQPGDVLTWRLSGNEPHTGIVIAERHPTSGYPLVVHNLGAGVRKDDLIRLSRPEGQFRFAPDTDTVVASLAR